MAGGAARDRPGQDEQRQEHKAARHGGMGLVARLRNYFFAGILVTAPVGITFWVSWRFITFIDDQVRPLVPVTWRPESYLPFDLPGFGLIIALVFLTLVGFLAAGYAGRALTQIADRLVSGVPVARSIYSWTKQVFETVLSQKATAFNEVVLVEYPCRGVWAVGFITGQTVGEVQELTEATVYNVFIPATPNPTTGFLLFVPEGDVHHVDLSVEEGIKLVISGGIVVPPKRVPGAPRPAAARPRDQAGPTPGETGRGARLGVLWKLRTYFFAGILVTAPISITIWLTWELVAYVDNRVMPMLPPAWNPETYLPFSIPGLGVLLAFVVLTVIGFFAAGLVGRTVVGLGERLLDRMPVIRSVYGALKQIFETVLREQSRAFRETVLIEYPRRDCWAIGFVTGQTEGHVQEATDKQVINVFLPTTPNPTSGFLLFVPDDEVIPLTMTVEEGIKMVVSGGIVTPPDRRKPGAAAAEGVQPAEVA